MLYTHYISSIKCSFKCAARRSASVAINRQRLPVGMTPGYIRRGPHCTAGPWSLTEQTDQTFHECVLPNSNLHVAAEAKCHKYLYWINRLWQRWTVGRIIAENNPGNVQCRGRAKLRFSFFPLHVLSYIIIIFIIIIIIIIIIITVIQAKQNYTLFIFGYII